MGDLLRLGARQERLLRPPQRASAAGPGWAHVDTEGVSETGCSAEELEDARNSMDANAYAREYECDFDASIEGAYYATEMAKAEADKRICRVPIEPTVKVDTWWDLGIDDATAIWFVQDVGQERRVIDYWRSGEGLPQIAKRLDAKDYRYGRHILPHDAEARELGHRRAASRPWRSWACATSMSSRSRKWRTGSTRPA
jgi:phage terminase large subunit